MKTHHTRRGVIPGWLMAACCLIVAIACSPVFGEELPDQKAQEEKKVKAVKINSHQINIVNTNASRYAHVRIKYKNLAGIDMIVQTKQPLAPNGRMQFTIDAVFYNWRLEVELAVPTGKTGYLPDNYKPKDDL